MTAGRTELIEARVVHLSAELRAAIAAFLGTPAGPSRAPDLADFERFAAQWRGLIPPDPAGRAIVAHWLVEVYGLGKLPTPGIDAALCLHSEDTRAAYLAASGRSLEDALTTRRRLARAAPIAQSEARPGSDLVDRLYNAFVWRALARGEALCVQGTRSDGLYIVVNGRLRVFVAGPDGTERLVRELGRGAGIGEMGLISGEPRSASVYAARHSEVVVLPRKAFERLVVEEPGFLLGITRQVVDRLRRPGTERRGHSTRTVAVVAAGNPPHPVEDFSRRLVDALGRIAPAALVDRARALDVLGHDPGREPAHNATYDSRLLTWLDALETDYRYVVYVTDGVPSSWSRLCLAQADLVVLMGLAAADPAPNALEHAILYESPRSASRRALALVHPTGTERPTGTARWLAERPVDMYVHTRTDAPADFDRLARRIAGRAIGLALGGGGARSFTHIGIVRALREVGVPIDVVGGTSMGAIIGGMVALGWEPDEMTARLRALFRPVLRPPDVTLPIVALTSGREMVTYLRELCCEARIEDLWTSFFCVSSNLTRGEVVVHDTGLLRTSLRASSSVPGIYPPVTSNGDLLVDGAVLNNLPADVMRGACPEGLVIGVNVDPARGLATPIEYGDHLGLGAILAARRRHRGVPGMRSILERATMLASIRESASIERSVDLYLHPPTDDIPLGGRGLLELAARRGYLYAAPLIRSWWAAQVGTARA
jgi:NTE family protein